MTQKKRERQQYQRKNRKRINEFNCLAGDLKQHCLQPPRFCFSLYTYIYIYTVRILVRTVMLCGHGCLDLTSQNTYALSISLSIFAFTLANWIYYPLSMLQVKHERYLDDGDTILGTQRYFTKHFIQTFIKALHQSTLSKHFIKALYPSTLAKHFTKTVYQNTLSKHFIKALYQTTLFKHFINVLLKAA